jgi:putative phosphoesterase
MKIGIISDTHDHYDNVVKAIEVFRKCAVETVLHAGDMISAPTAQLFSGLKGVRFIAVFGNCDIDRHLLRSTVEGFGGEIHEAAFQGRLDGKTVCMAHTPQGVRQSAESGEYDLVVYGHTHRDDIQQVGTTLILNPGEATDTRTGLGQVLILDTGDLSLDIEPLT